MSKAKSVQIREYLLENPNLRDSCGSDPEMYRFLGKQFDTTAKYAAQAISRGRDNKQIAPNKLVHTAESRKRWEETEDGASLDYVGEEQITTEQQAIDFFNVDMTKFEVEKSVGNNWSTPMKDKVWIYKETGKRWEEGTKFNEDELQLIAVDNKRVNYQFKVWFRRIIDFKLNEFPKLPPIKVKPTKGGQTWIILPCVHRPFHRQEIWDKVMQMIVDNRKNIYGIILPGDYLDLRSLSTHDEFIPEGIDLAMEYNDGYQGILELKRAFGKYWKSVKKKFLWGNHEFRFDRDLKAIRKYGSSLPNPAEALRLEENDFEIRYDWRNDKITLGNDLDVYHGVYFGANPCKAHLDKIPNRNHVFAHTHRIGHYGKGGFNAWNIGWMGDIQSEGFKYSHRFTKGDHANGWGEVFVDSKGQTIVNQIKCLGDNFYYAGKLY